MKPHLDAAPLAGSHDVKLFVALAILDQVEATTLADPTKMRAVMLAGVAKGGFSLHDLVITTFEPTGLTGTAVLGESHLSVHTWPTEGRIFVDVASCTTRASVELALDAVVSELGARVVERKVETLG